MSIVIDFSLIWAAFESFITLFVILLTWHFLAEYPLQDDFLAINKSPSGRPYQGQQNAIDPHPNWFMYMLIHCFIQAAGVFMITMSLWLAVVGFAAHYFIDCRHCNGTLTDWQEQRLYALTLAIIAFIVMLIRYGFFDLMGNLL